MSKKSEVKEKESFFEKMKNDKKYKAKVQLFGMFVFVGVLVIFLNISSMNSGSYGNLLDSDVLGGGSDNTVNVSLLEKLADNYSYSINYKVVKKSTDESSGEEVVLEDSIVYKGKSYGNNVEVNKFVEDASSLYYEVNDSYYSMIDGKTSLVQESLVYDKDFGKYVKVDNILSFIKKASLDYVTNYSNGKRVSLYKLVVKDVIPSSRSEEVVEINVEEENGVLSIKLDYSNLFKVIDNSISSSIVEVSVTDIGEVLEFEVNLDEDNNLE